MMKVNRPHHSTCEKQAKFINGRILTVEKYFGELNEVLGLYTKKLAGLRDRNDDIARVVQNYAESENVNTTLQGSLQMFATILSEVGNCRDHQVQKMENEILNEFVQYGTLCRELKEGIKKALVARDREVTRKKNLDRVRERNPRNRAQVSVAEAEFIRANAEVSQLVKALEQNTDNFEKKKLEDLRCLFLNYMKIELVFHAKAIESYTSAYQAIMDINVNEDIQEFREVLHAPESASRLETVKKTSFKSSLANFFSPHLASSFSNSQSGNPLSNEKNAHIEKPNQSEHVQEFEDSSSESSEEEIEKNKRLQRK